MKNQRIHYVILFLIIGTLSWSLYFRIAFDQWITLHVNEPYLLKKVLSRLISGRITEMNLKVVAIAAPLVSGYLHRFYSDRKIKVNLFIGLAGFAVILLVYPMQRLVHLPVYLGMALTIGAYLIYIRSIMAISVWYFSKRLGNDQFNINNQSFPQTKKIIKAKYGFSLGYDYFYDKKRHQGFLNFVNVFRSVFVWGIMGSGKTYSFISPIIYELMKLNFTMMVYDLKYPSLSSKTYAYYKDINPKDTSFYQICTTDMSYSHRCNPIAPRYIPSITEIEKICNNILVNLKRPDESESAFFKGTASGLFVGLVALSKEMQIKYDLPVCSIPHVSILASAKTKYLLPILLSKRDLVMKVSSLRDAFDGGSAMEQLAGITATLQEKLSRLYHLDAYYIFSGEGDFSLDLNNPDQKKIVVVGCDKDKADVMAPYLSMIVETVGKEANKPGKAPFANILDEMSSFYYGGLVDFLESGRENLCALVAGIQGVEQLEKKYPRAEANSIIGIQGSVICGMGGTKTAGEISKRIGKTNQKRTGLNQQMEGSQSINHTFYREELIAVDTIGNFSQGEFCGVLADSLESPIKQKRFWGRIKSHECHDVPKVEQLPLLHDFWNQEAQEVFKRHWKDMIDHGFFQDFQKAIEKNEFIFLPKTVSFYIKYLGLSSEELELMKRKYEALEAKTTKKSKTEGKEKGFTYQKYMADFFSKRLEQVIIKNEKHQFLHAYFEQMYADIEFWIKKEYYAITGTKIEEDLFNIGDFKLDDLEEVPF